jgi:hypothetical protein
MSLVRTLVPFLVLRNSKSSLTTFYTCFWNWMKLTADLRIIGGGLSLFPGAVALQDEASLPADSVFISVAQSEAKKLGTATPSRA